MTSKLPSVCVIVPVFNEAGEIGACLDALVATQHPDQIVVADGDSTDATSDVVAAWRRHHEDALHRAGIRFRWLSAPRGRASQMNAGATVADRDILVFLHADARLPAAALDEIKKCIAAGHMWGRFDVYLDGAGWMFRVVERAMNVRSAMSGIATGDQALFVRRDLFGIMGGYAAIPLMEDVELSRRLKWVERPQRIRTPVTVSVRRWRRGGTMRTILQMWALRLAYWAGVPPARLARFYRQAR